MKKIIIASMAAALFAATTAFACANCGCADKKEHKNHVEHTEHKESSEKIMCDSKKNCADCTEVDGKKVMCEKCKGKKEAVKKAIEEAK